MADATHDPDPEPATEGRGGEVDAATDPTNVARRRFFRQFAGELIHTAATVAGAAQAIQRASAEAAGAILDPVGTATRIDARSADQQPDADASTGPTGFRTPFREGDGVLLLIDQRKLPDQLVELEIRNAPEAASAIREMVVRGAPAIGQVAALGLALSAERAQGTQ
ncbi:MAG: hypothetical protein H0V73_12345, partial [Chloroflexi bacterium]|nr:hypothetical protein [Chloroflexota bacterium]